MEQATTSLICVSWQLDHSFLPLQTMTLKGALLRCYKTIGKAESIHPMKTRSNPNHDRILRLKEKNTTLLPVQQKEKVA